MSKIKIHIRKGIFNYKMLEEHFEIVKEIKDADYFICWDYVPEEVMKNPDLLKRVIYIGYEVPLTTPVYLGYLMADHFHTSFMYNPNPDKPNQFKLTENPIYYPVSPFFENDIKREDTTLTKRTLYYSGARCKGLYTYVPDTFGLNLKDERDSVAEFFMERGRGTIHGVGWSAQTKFPDTDVPWRLKKIQDISKTNDDFHLCMENFAIKGLVSERLHDGFSSDRVMLYFGETEIEKYVPSNCFIDLRKYFDYKNKKFNCDEILKVMDNITQEEYDTILNNAREFRKSMDREGFKRGTDRITKIIIDRIKND